MLYNRVIILLLLVVSPSLYAENNITLLDRYHDELCHILVDTSNSIDNYFVESNSTEESSTTWAELINSFALENGQAFEKDIRLRLRLSLPKIQKNLHLVFEDETNDNTLYDSTKLTNEHLEEKNYYLRLEYFKYIQQSLNITFAGGLRIRDLHLVPYLNIRANYELYSRDKLESELYNRFRYYTDGEIEDTFEFNMDYSIDDSIDLFWKNQLSYSNKNLFQTIINDLSWIKSLNEREQVRAGVGIVSSLKNLKQPKSDYTHLHLLYHHLFYKDWIYYQIAPSILWRESNDFHHSYRYMINLGIIFKND
jgi:hypothetical protein